MQPYLSYWITLEELCDIEIEKKLLGDLKLSPHSEIEEEANNLVKNMSQEELQDLESEVRTQL